MPDQLQSDKLGNSGHVPSKTTDDINDFFKTIDSPEESEKEEKSSKKQEDTDKEVKADKDKDDKVKDGDEGDIELVEGDEEDDAEKLDLTKPDEDIEIGAPPRKKEILAKYPEFYKDFPFMEKMMYRDREYTQLFGSLDDAKELAEKAEIFNQFETQLLSGDTVEVLKNVKETDSKAFDKIVDNYLPALAKVDKEAYYEVINNVSKKLIMEMFREGDESKNDDLKEAALLVNQFLFGTSKFTAPKQRVTEEATKKDEVAEERRAYLRERFESSRDELQTKVDNTLKSTIAEYIDPKGVMTSYIKKNAINDALRMVKESMTNDSALRSNLDRLWRSAFDSKFDKNSLDKVKSHYLGRAKQSLKSAIIKARTEALKDLPPREKSEEKEEREETPRNRGHISSGRPPSQPKKNEMKKGESVTDFFMRE
jgi:hypothetical protein